MLKHLPNALTLLRLVLAPVVAWAVWRAQLGDDKAWAIAAAILFVIAALTDLFDGMVARAFNAESKFGRIIDPIADKALVGLPLIALSILLYTKTWEFWPLVAGPTAVIVVRDVLMTGARLMAPDGEGARVSQLAKWKTALELIVVGGAVMFPLAPAVMGANIDGALVLDALAWLVWNSLLVVAAGLSAYTGVRYVVSK
ncbi:MAG: CDP-alcohol phosphatidyltransferase family protein [Alphaproteobacteria bacterium]